MDIPFPGEEIRTSFATVRLVLPQLVENIIDDYVTVERKDIIELKQINKKITAGLPYAVLVNSGAMSSITKDARELSASSEFVQQTIAKAIIVRSLGHQLICNVYLKINKPKIKTALFSDRNKAIEWLKTEILDSNASFNK